MGEGDEAPAGLNRPLAPPRPDPRPGRCAALALLLAAAAALALGAAFQGVGPADLDAGAMQSSLATRSSGLTAAALIVTNVGSTWSMGVLAVVVAAWSWWRGRPADAAFALVAMAGGALVMTGLKRWFDRPRPPAVDQVVQLHNASLPSGHATMAAAVIGSVVVLAWRGRGRAARTLIVAAGVLWVGAVGLTRIYLGAHWFSDVIAGWLVGTAWLAVCVAVWSRWRAHTAAR